MARRRPPRTFIQRYAPLLLAGLGVLVVVGMRTDGDLGLRLADRLYEDLGPAGEADEARTSTTADEDDPPGTLPSTTANPHIDDPDEVSESLRLALLTEADLPEGWGPAADTGSSTEVCPGHDPAAVVDPEDALRASFAASDDGPFLTSFVGEFSGDGGADDYLDELEDALEACDGLEADNGLVYEVQRTGDAALGDRSVTATVRIRAGEAEVRARLLGVRVGDRVAMIGFSARGDADAAVAVDALEAVVARLDR